MEFLKRLLRDCSAVSSAEYALILAIAGVMIGAAALTLGNNITHAIGRTSNELAALQSVAANDPDGAAAAVSGGGTQSGTASGGHGKSASAPGQTGDTPGQSGGTPANGAAAPGQAGNTPGQSGSAPGGGNSKN